MHRCVFVKTYFQKMYFDIVDIVREGALHKNSLFLNSIGRIFNDNEKHVKLLSCNKSVRKKEIKLSTCIYIDKYINICLYIHICNICPNTIKGKYVWIFVFFLYVYEKP